MRKALLFCLLFLVAFQIHAQRCAVLEFKAGAGISQADVEGISAIFNTYFQPAGYTMVERTQIDKVIDEQGFQRSSITQYQMVRLGVILNVSKVVVGDVTIAMGQYNVDVRVVDVETGTESGKEGATFTPGSSYRSTMRKLAQSLAAQIAITPAGTVYPSQAAAPSQPKKRSSVEILLGYLKVFPNELGVFQAPPSTIIAQINSQAQYGYNNWRIPSDEELSLLRANNYLGSGEYMTKESRRGIVLLVSDGEKQNGQNSLIQQRHNQVPNTSSLSQGKYGADSVGCIKYLSYYQEYYKQKNYDFALPYWRRAFSTCPPTASQNMLVHGTTLLVSLINKNSWNESYQKELVDSLLSIQDIRAQYYPKSKRAALNNKGIYLAKYIKDNPQKRYEVYEDIISELQTETNPKILLYDLDAAVEMYNVGILDANTVLRCYRHNKDLLNRINQSYNSDTEEIAKIKKALDDLLASSRIDNTYYY